jgi:hypothetical protein
MVRAGAGEGVGACAHLFAALARYKLKYSGYRRRINARGYVEVQVGKRHPRANKAGMQYEHRLLMEEILGRALATYEEVHHLDGDRSNNDLLNLEFLEKEHHSRYHSVFRVRDLLGRFQPDEDGDEDVPWLPPGAVELVEVPF